MIETLSLCLGDRKSLDRDNLEARLFNLGENGSGKTLAYRVRLDNAECAL
jgi:hypothetical protein